MSQLEDLLGKSPNDMTAQEMLQYVGELRKARLARVAPASSGSSTKKSATKKAGTNLTAASKMVADAAAQGKTRDELLDDILGDL